MFFKTTEQLKIGYLQTSLTRVALAAWSSTARTTHKR